MRMQIQIEFLSSALLAGKGGKEKIRFIVDSIKDGKILVLEDPLDHSEETKLIEATMKKVSPSFPGIEISTLGSEAQDLRTMLIKMLGGKTGGLTVIGPSSLVKQVKRDPMSIRLFAGDGRKR